MARILEDAPPPDGALLQLIAQDCQSNRVEIEQLGKRLGGRLDRLEDNMNTRMDAFEHRMDAMQTDMNARFEGVDARFESIDARLEAIDARFESVDARFEAMDAKIDSLRAYTSQRIDRVDERLVGIFEMEEKHDKWLMRLLILAEGTGDQRRTS